MTFVKVPPHARAAFVRRGHRFAAYPRCSTDPEVRDAAVTSRARGRLEWVDALANGATLRSTWRCSALAVWKRPHTRVLAVAVSVAALCFPLWILARLELGSAFSLGAKANQLVTTGLYSRIRHPLYFFGTIAGLASVLALPGLVDLRSSIAGRADYHRPGHSRGAGSR
jgi:protein-S-isoprenylcysteine O-methyltransferase Ste14